MILIIPFVQTMTPIAKPMAKSWRRPEPFECKRWSWSPCNICRPTQKLRWVGPKSRPFNKKKSNSVVFSFVTWLDTGLSGTYRVNSNRVFFHCFFSFFHSMPLMPLFAAHLFVSVCCYFSYHVLFSRVWFLSFWNFSCDFFYHHFGILRMIFLIISIIFAHNAPPLPRNTHEIGCVSQTKPKCAIRSGP